MKTLLTICLCSLAFALVSLAQAPPPAKAPPATGGTSPAAQAPTNPAAAAQQPPATNLAPGQQPPATNLAPGQQPPPPPGEPGAVGQPPAGQAPAVGQPGAPGAVTSPAAAGATSPAAAAAASAAPVVAATPEQPAGFLAGNWLIDKFHKGGPVMWPILIVSIVALTVVLERCIWWGGRWFRRDPKRIEKVFTAIENGDTAEASRLSARFPRPCATNALERSQPSAQLARGRVAGCRRHRDQAGRTLPGGNGYACDARAFARSVGHNHRADQVLQFSGQRGTRCASRHWRYCRSADCDGVRSGHRHFCVDSV